MTRSIRQKNKERKRTQIEISKRSKIKTVKTQKITRGKTKIIEGKTVNPKTQIRVGEEN